MLVEHLHLEILSAEQPVTFHAVSEVISEDVQKISTPPPFSDQDDVSDDVDENNNNSSESTKAEPRRRKKVYVRSDETRRVGFMAMFKASSLKNKDRLDQKGIHTSNIPCLILCFHQVHMLYVCMQAMGMFCMHDKNIGPPLHNSIPFSRYIALHFNCSQLTGTPGVFRYPYFPYLLYLV